MRPRVVVVHCRYQFRGGEDVVVENEVALLRRRGVEVALYELSNAAIEEMGFASRALLGVKTTWNGAAKRALRREIERFRANVVHFHNTFPLLSPAGYFAAREAGAKVVQTLHNYRLICANAQLLRRQAPCERCLRGRFFYGAVYRCYRDSLGASAATVLMQYTHHGLGTYRRAVDRYIVLTEFAKSKFAAAGVPAAKLSVKPNSLVETPAAGDGGGGFVLYVGRLSAEKGLPTLLEAWRGLKDVSLKIVGDGPLRETLQRSASQAGLPVQLLGTLKREAVLALMGQAKLLVLPSECYEGFPMAIVESFAVGTPVVASDIGSLSEIVEDGRTGRTFEPRNRGQLAAVVRSLLADETALRAMREACRDRYLTRYSGEENAARLIAIYEEVLGRSRDQSL
jgi:glycosyltransferase involved in cell wall biosynthesis